MTGKDLITAATRAAEDLIDTDIERLLAADVHPDAKTVGDAMERACHRVGILGEPWRLFYRWAMPPPEMYLNDARVAVLLTERGRSVGARTVQQWRLDRTPVHGFEVVQLGNTTRWIQA